MMRCAPLISITAQSVWRGTSMDDALRPVALHGGDLAAADAPQQLDISQTHPCEWRTDSRKLWAFSFWCRRLHGRTKLAGGGRLWTMCCTPSISITAQSLRMAVILPPENAPRAVQVIQRARWMTSEQGPRIPAEVGGTAQPSRRGHL